MAVTAHLSTRWMEQALCREIGPELFFPTGSYETEDENFRDNGSGRLDAIAACDMCPVKKLCLEYALGHPHNMDGVWGGTTENQRRSLRRRRGNHRNEVSFMTDEWVLSYRHQQDQERERLAREEQELVTEASFWGLVAA